MSFTRVALVTGAAQGIGRAIALQLASDGLDLALNDLQHQVPQLEEVKNLVEAKGRKATITPADVTKEEQVKAMITKCAADLGGLDVIVANAGIVLWKPFLESKKLKLIVEAIRSNMWAATVGEFDRVMEINVKGLFVCYKEAAEFMIKQGRGGRIIGASSVAGKRGKPIDKQHRPESTEPRMLRRYGRKVGTKSNMYECQSLYWG